MNSKTTFLLPAAALLSLFSSVSIAGTPAAGLENLQITFQPVALEQMIQKNTEQKQQAESNKYTQLTLLAGSRKNELEQRKQEVETAYKALQDSKLAASRNADMDSFRTVEAASQAYSKANRSFIELQKEILAKNGASAELVVAFNAAPPTAAGKK